MTTEHRRRRGRYAGVLLAACLSSTLSACGSDGIFTDDAPTRACGVVVDASGSGADFHADERIKTKLESFLEQQSCGQLTFVALNSLSDTSTCNEERLDLDPKVGDPQAVRAAQRQEAVTRALRLLDCARKESHDSNVLGALRKAASTRPSGTGPYAVLVISDMVQADRRVNMLTANISTPEARAAIIDQLGDLTPHLTDTVLYPTDLSANLADPKHGLNVREFWTELFATDASGRPKIEMNYG
ncbi:Uncharacterised protein [Amycolatopsis camponoti]|uniref:VWA domain-containing protein n=1 Tax=Amycolatopsis camponoti TaxID=2606593 RepID=A0A6I8LDG1_9PSEU|nr:hypothetical protein [Amycolatopsis camponoti]VVJ15007.1 Uncharacterised protein [Amycolatopsis camponoti]